MTRGNEFLARLDGLSPGHPTKGLQMYALLDDGWEGTQVGNAIRIVGERVGVLDMKD